MKKIAVISTSLHKDSNSDVLAREFARGAKEAGNDVEYISLVGKKISYCIGCFACHKLRHKGRRPRHRRGDKDGGRGGVCDAHLLL